MNKNFLIIAAALGALSVLLGAFGAHVLKENIPSDAFAVFETAVRYQFYHVFALMACGILFQSFNNKRILWGGRSFIAGIILFSGSLYALTYFKALENETMNWLGAITPVGGLCFIAGWILLAAGILKKSTKY